MTRAFIGLETAGKGFDTSHLITVRVGLPTTGYRDPGVRAQFVSDVLDRLRGTPGVVAATDGGLPTDARPIMLGAVTFADRPSRPTAPLIVPLHEVPVGYFGALHLPLVSGRLFGPEDDRNTVIIERELRAQVLGGRVRRRRAIPGQRAGLADGRRRRWRRPPDDRRRFRTRPGSLLPDREGAPGAAAADVGRLVDHRLPER